MTPNPIVLAVRIIQYRLSTSQIVLLAEEFYGKPLTNGEDGQTIEFGFEDAAHKTQFNHALDAFKT